MAKELGLPVTGKPDEFVKIDALVVGSAALRGVKADIEALSEMFPDPGGPRDILSAASFPGYLLVFDYPGRKIKVHGGELPKADARRIFEYSAEQLIPLVPLRLGDVELRAHVDSGADGALTLPTKYMQEVPLASKPKQTGRSATPQGEFPIYTAQVKDNISLGDLKLDVKQIEFSDITPFPGPPTGNIGNGILKDFVVILDAKNRRITVERPTSASHN